jgi:hypothetical protein
MFRNSMVSLACAIIRRTARKGNEGRRPGVGENGSRYNDVSPEAYRKLGFPGAEDLWNMFQFNRDFESDFCGARSLEFSRMLDPSLQTFDEWLAVNGKRIPIEKALRRAAGA